jgi:phosphoglucomutase
MLHSLALTLSLSFKDTFIKEGNSIWAVPLDVIMMCVYRGEIIKLDKQQSAHR